MTTAELGKRALAADRMRQVCDIAIRLFLEHGYDNTPMSMIAKEAGLTKAGIYHHFESKQDLLHAVHKQLLDEGMVPIIDRARDIADPEERLRTFIVDLCVQLAGDPAARILINESRGLSAEQFKDIRTVWKGELDLVRDAITELQSVGRVRREINPTFAAFGAIGMCSWLLYWFDDRRAENAPEVGRTFASMVLGGLLDRRASPQFAAGSDANRTPSPLRSSASADSREGVEEMEPGQSRVFADVVRRHAVTFGDKPAFVSAAGAVSFAAVNERINRLNHALSAFGLAKGDRVAILSHNRPEYFEVYGVAKSGLVAVPLNWRLSARELLQTLVDSAPSVIVAEPGFTATLDELRPQLVGIRGFVVFGNAAPGWMSYETLLATASATEPTVDALPDDPLCLLYSSGTTGTPKGTIMTHRRALDTSRAIAGDMLRLTADDVGLSVMPLFHAGGMWYHLFPSFASGGTTVLLPQFDAAAVLAAIQSEGVTHVHMVPTMISVLLNQPDVERTDVSRLRTIYYAASSIPLPVLKRALQVFKGCGFVQSYGLTEMGGVSALLPEDHALAIADPARQKLLLSCGRPMPGVSVEIRDSSGAAVPTGTPGEITVQSERTITSYWNNPAATANALREGWLLTGDVGFLDADGYLYLVDRKHDMIVSGGENVYPREVEDILCEDPAIAEVAVFAVPDPKWVERVAAAVVLKPGHTATAEEIRHRAAQRLAPYKCPKTVIFVDRLPKSATGKILKKDLRSRYADVATSSAGTA